MRKITPKELTDLIPDEETVKQYDPIHTRYIGWNKLDHADKAQLILIGKLDNEGNTDSYTVYKDQYWQQDAPIAFAYYPYAGCEIYRYQQQGGLYFVYTEFGGHAPEIRCRLIQRQLIV